MNYREKYAEAYRIYHAKKNPKAMATGYFKPKHPNVNTANGLATWIENFCKWMGHEDIYRQNTTGRYRPGKIHKTNIYANGEIQEKGIWLKSEKGTGHADITGGIKGKRVSFEIKIGKDTIKPDQLQRQAKARADNNIYEFIRSPEDFLKVYEFIMSF